MKVIKFELCSTEEMKANLQDFKQSVNTHFTYCNYGCTMHGAYF